MNKQTTIADLYTILLSPNGQVKDIIEADDGKYWFMLELALNAPAPKIPTLVVLEPNERITNEHI